jgi:hypothetical protein
MAEKKLVRQDALSSVDWAGINRKAWNDQAFRDRLERDPTGAVREYGQEVGITWDRILVVAVPEVSNPAQLDLLAHIPPACC